ncbi:MAG: nuclear transport factor 2 family protein [Candidatus Acidiferrales bacterium]
MKILQIAALVACLAAPAFALAQAPAAENSKAAQEVIDFRNRFIAAEEHRDRPFLEKAFTSDFYALNPQGLLLDKAQQIANLMRPDRTFTLSPATEVRVHFHGATAILWERVTVDGTDKGKHFGGDFRFVRVFVKEPGGWKVALIQGVPVSAKTDSSK